MSFSYHKPIGTLKTKFHENYKKFLMKIIILILKKTNQD